MKIAPPKSTTEPTVESVANKLRAAIYKISLQPNTEMAALLQRYMGFLAPTMAKYGIDRFPRTYRPHIRTVTEGGKPKYVYNQDRTTESHKPAVLVFHVASAIAEYFSIANCNTSPVDRLALSVFGISAFKRRVELIEDIAKRTLNGYQVHGNSGIGYCLMTPAQIAEWGKEINVVPDAKKAEGAGLSNA